MPSKPKTTATENATPAKRGRRPHAPEEQHGPEFVGKTPPVIAAMETRMHVAIRDTEATVRAVAATLGYLLPADCTDPDLIQRDIAANMRRSVEACLEVGRGLAVLKAACEHGNFIARLDVLGIDRKVAAKFMASATKFSNVSTSRHLTDAIGSQSKLFEMLVLDDEQIEELALTGQTGELALDDVAIMSVKELRAAVREERKEKAAIARLAAERRDELDKIEMKGRKQIAEPWSAQIVGINNEIGAVGTMADECFSKFLTFVDAIESQIDNADEGSEHYRAAKSVIHRLCAGAERLCHLAAGLRDHCETRISGYIADDRTHILDDNAKASGGHTSH